VVAFVLARLGGAAVSVALLLVLVHGLVAAAPGDPLVALLGTGVIGVPEEQRERMRSEAGLDRPWPQRAAAYLGAALRGDLGTSRRSGRPVADELRDRLPATVALAAAALTLALALGLATGVAAAAFARSWLDPLLTGALLLGAAVPVYWTGLLLLYAFALALGWLPASGGGSWRHLLLPALSLGLASAAPLARVTRAALLDALAAPHVVAARARGLSRAQVLLRHGLRNALAPVVTVAGIDLGRMLGGVVFVEAVFGWPGLGHLAIDAIVARDLALVQGVVLVTAVAVLALGLLVDLAYLRLDPRVRYR
jgi:ABC-type dipeptide/oligopeptide/nickel transport system permease component